MKKQSKTIDNNARVGFISLLIRRMHNDRMTNLSASLAFTTILALVPLCTVVFSILSSFSIFEEPMREFKRILFSNLTPELNQLVQPYLEQFIKNASNMTIIGIIFLIATSILLINSINTILNYIWKTERKRSPMYQVTMYWTMLSLFPLLICSSFAASKFILSSNWLPQSEIMIMVLKCTPFLMSAFVFWVLYCVMPTESVSSITSVFGALIAAGLFAIAKKGFGLYVIYFPTYESIYGVLSSIPLLLIWIYISWYIILFGAEFSAALSAYFKRPSKKMVEATKIVTDSTDYVPQIKVNS